MEDQTIKWLKKMIGRTGNQLGEETRDLPKAISLGGKLKAYKDCLEFINAHKVPKKSKKSKKRVDCDKTEGDSSEIVVLLRPINDSQN